MRNHRCPFSSYCTNYHLDKCQGCTRVDSHYPISNSLGRKKDAWLNGVFEEQVRYNLGEMNKSVYDQFVEQLGYKTGKKKMEKKETTTMVPEIKNVYFNKPMTIVIWADGTKTMVKCQKGDKYSKETGLAVAIAKKVLGTNKSGSNFNEVFKKWIPEYGEKPARKKKEPGSNGKGDSK